MARRDTESDAVVPDGVGKVDPPTIEDGVPSKCLSFEIRSDWGHFRRIDRTVTKQTYRIPPRTTVAGLLAAIAGVRRDGYYDVFAPDCSAIAISPIGSIRTVTQPTLGLGTHPGETMVDASGTGKKTIKVKYPDSTDNRQIHSYELLVDPAYRIDVAVEDERFYSVLKHRLETGTSYYPPSMGLSEHLAWIELSNGGEVEFESQPGTSDRIVAVDSAVPNGVDDVILQPDVRCDVERVPAYMEAHEGGRRTTGFVDYAFSDDQLKVRPKSVTPTTVGNRTVVFE